MDAATAVLETDSIKQLKARGMRRTGARVARHLAR